MGHAINKTIMNATENKRTNKERPNERKKETNQDIKNERNTEIDKLIHEGRNIYRKKEIEK